MTTHLVLTALGDDKPGLVNELSEAILQCGCNIEDSRMIALGGEFAIILMVGGQWNALAKLEDALPPLSRKLDMNISSRRTEGEKKSDGKLPYAVDVVALDNPGIVHHLASFFSSRDINIEELETGTYSAAHTGTPMFSVHMEIGIPADMRISSLRDEFLEICDELNLDAIIEPVKI